MQIDKKMEIIIPTLDMTLFGNALSDLAPNIAEAIRNDLSKAPSKYLEFLQVYGAGELSSYFRIESELVLPEKIYGRNIPELNNILIFGSDIGDYLYAFDTENNWEVVELDTSGEIFERHGNFDKFINKVLDEIINNNSLV